MAISMGVFAALPVVLKQADRCDQFAPLWKSILSNKLGFGPSEPAAKNDESDIEFASLRFHSAIAPNG